MSKVKVAIPAVVYKLERATYFRCNMVSLPRSVFGRSLETKSSLMRFLMGSYRNIPEGNKEMLLSYSGSVLRSGTSSNGSCEVLLPGDQPSQVETIVSGTDGEPILMPHGCDVYDLSRGDLIVSDVDDTLMISYASRPFRKLMTLLRVTPYKRKHVEAVVDFLKDVVSETRPVVYLTNSEANLFPVIKAFMSKHRFPSGPLLMKPFLHRKSYRKGYRSTGHKQAMLTQLAEGNPNASFTLIGDTGQGDAKVYGQFIERFADRVTAVYLHDIGSIQSKSSIRELDRACNEKGIVFKLFEAGDSLNSD